MQKLREIKNGNLFYNGYDLEALANKYGTPLKVTFLGVIKEHIESLKKTFAWIKKELHYRGDFIYLNANKANYGKEEIETAFHYGDGLETSSYYDLLLTEKMFKKYPEYKDKWIVANGYKKQDYLDKIVELSKEGYHIIDIIDSYDEYLYLKNKNVNLEVGLRIHLKALYSEDGVVLNDRFGLNDDEIMAIVDDLANTKLKLTTIHFHQRGFDYEEDKFEENIEKAFKYYAMCQKKFPNLINFDIGGGTPLPVEENFDYEVWARKFLKMITKYSEKEGVMIPNIITENGKFSQKDSTVNIYKIVAKKNTDKYPWFIVDGSLLIALPEMYALGEPVLVTPINHLNDEMIKARLGGITCDCDDIYYLKDKGYIKLPNTCDLLIGCIGTGSYQNSMNGKGGVHHCLLPEERDLVIDVDGNEFIRNELQTIEDIYKLIKF